MNGRLQRQLPVSAKSPLDGDRICRGYDGKVRAQNYGTAKALFEQNLARTAPRLAGGKFAWPLPEAL